MNTQTFIAKKSDSATRLDQYCAEQMPEMTRSRLKNSIKKILVNNMPAKLSKKIYGGDHIYIEWEDIVPEHIIAESIPLRILYEDAYITIINKKQGMVTHPAAGHWSGTLVNALLWHLQEQSCSNSVRPGIVHRLDKDTSGVILTAKTPEMEAKFQELFKTRKIKKIYIALLKGSLKNTEGTISINIVRDPKNRKRFTTTSDTSKGKSSKTSYKVIQRFGLYTLVFFKLHTGRTHQIRVISKYLGCPILGDPIYGHKDSKFPNATLMLHAYRLEFAHPIFKKKINIIAPLPKRFKTTIESI